MNAKYVEFIPKHDSMCNMKIGGNGQNAQDYGGRYYFRLRLIKLKVMSDMTFIYIYLGS